MRSLRRGAPSLCSQDTTDGLRIHALSGQIDQEELFPDEHRELKYIAESDLAAWLLHPNELDAVPDNIELAEVIEREGGEPREKYRFYVFKFRTLEPHWMAKHGWVAGVAGPYWDGEDPEDAPPGVFSRFEAFNLMQSRRTPGQNRAHPLQSTETEGLTSDATGYECNMPLWIGRVFPGIVTWGIL